MSENMAIWNKLCITDPNHTKRFKRAGGFSGDAIKPMYAIQKMTEAFGACGEGWGYTKPEYQIVDGTDGQKLVYCTVGLWHKECDTPHLGRDNMVWGVGGDFIIVKQSSGLRSDDEAFKKAFTDALMNAMKHIGMSADVHMGQFDGNKYETSEPKIEPKPEPITIERKAFIIETIQNAKDVATVKELNAAAKVECEKANDAAAWQEILKTAKERINQLQPPQENTIDQTS